MTDSDRSSQSRSDQQEALSERLREAREYLGLSQEFVSQHTGIPRVAISGIETGKRKIDAVELDALATLYKYPITYFLEGSGEEPPYVKAIARAATSLTEDDRRQVLQFAEFLRAYGRSSGNTAGSSTGNVSDE